MLDVEAWRELSWEGDFLFLHVRTVHVVCVSECMYTITAMYVNTIRPLEQCAVQLQVLRYG